MTTNQARIYLSYTNGEPWVLTWHRDSWSGVCYRLTFATREMARQYASDNGII